MRIKSQHCLRFDVQNYDNVARCNFQWGNMHLCRSEDTASVKQDLILSALLKFWLQI